MKFQPFALRAMMLKLQKNMPLWLSPLIALYSCQSTPTAAPDQNVMHGKSLGENITPVEPQAPQPQPSDAPTPQMTHHDVFYDSVLEARSSTPPVTGSLRIGELSGFPVDYNADVEKWMRHFLARDGKTLQQWLIRSRPYERMIKEALVENGLPETLFYVPLIESGFIYRARSPKAATGPWQFMKSTAKLYDLRMDEWVDERHDPVKSTHAAARLLKNLYGQYQDWYLALAAYNAGPGRISNALRKEKVSSYWSLVDKSLLKQETKEYVPKLLAVMMIAENPGAFGLSWESDGGASNLPYTFIELDRPLEIAAIERELMLPRDTIKKWNPKLLGNITPPTASKLNPFRLKIHVDHASKLYANLSHLPSFEVDYVKTHRIMSGDTIQKIARLYGASSKNILKVNPNLDTRRLKIGRTLIVPVRNPKLSNSAGVSR